MIRKFTYKLLFTVLLVIVGVSVYAQSQGVYLIKLKSWKAEKKVKVKSYTRTNIEYIYKNKKYSITTDELNYIKPFNKNDIKFKKILIFRSGKKKYSYKGNIIYQDQKRISIEVKGQLISLNADNVEDILNIKEFEEDQSKSPSTALVWSMVIPGLGQAYTYNRTGSALLYGTLFMGATFSSIYFNLKSISYYDRFKQSRYSDIELYNKYETNYYIGLGSIIAVGLIYIWNIIDAYIFFERKYNVEVNPYKKEIVGYNYKFQIINKQNNNKEFRLSLNFTF